MSDAIVHFMWGYQPHFRIAQECVSKSTFELLDERFAPQVFLVGVLVEPRENRFPACVEPEQDFWAKSAEFDSVLTLAEEIRKRYPERELMQSHPVAQMRQDDALRRRSVRDAIQKIVEESPGKPKELVYFVAYPTKVEDYFVSVVLGLQKFVLEAHPTLTRNSVPIHEYRNLEVPISLIDAVTRAYLDKASGELRLPDPGSELSELNAEEILRDGASRLLTSLAYRADSRSHGWYGFLNSCTNLTATYYEGAEGAGTLVLARTDHPSLEKVIQFQVPPKLHVARSARKILQLASRGLALHTNSVEIFGLVKIGDYEAIEEDLFTVGILGHHHWQVLHNAQVLMGVKDCKPYLPKPPFDEERLKKDLLRMFTKMTKRNVDRILALVREAGKESHGTLLVISSRAKRESKRLATQGTPIAPRTLSPKLLHSLTSIDGAVLMSPKGTCYAIGVILDGMASEAGNAARGARYNSAIRYILSCKFPALAVIVSEDGGVDFFSKA